MWYNGGNKMRNIELTDAICGVALGTIAAIIVGLILQAPSQSEKNEQMFEAERSAVIKHLRQIGYQAGCIKQGNEFLCQNGPDDLKFYCVDDSSNAVACEALFPAPAVPAERLP